MAAGAGWVDAPLDHSLTTRASVSPGRLGKNRETLHRPEPFQAASRQPIA